MDPRLVALSKAAERGDVVPVLRLIMQGDLFTGIPASGAYFESAMQNALEVEWEHVATARARHERQAQPMDPAALAMRSLGGLGPQDRETETVLTLRDVAWRSVVLGTVLLIPALRVDIAAVNAWWIVGGQETDPAQPYQWLDSGPTP